MVSPLALTIVVTVSLHSNIVTASHNFQKMSQYSPPVSPLGPKDFGKPLRHAPVSPIGSPSEQPHQRLSDSPSDQASYDLPSYYTGADSDPFSDCASAPTSPEPQMQAPRHETAALPPRGIERYYPPSSYRCDVSDDIQKHEYAPGSPLSHKERARLHKVVDADRLRKSELRAKVTVPADNSVVVPELAHLRTAAPRKGPESGAPPLTAVLKQEPPPAALPRKTHRRRSSLQRIKNAAAQAGQELKDSAVKVSAGLKQGSQIVSHGLKEGSHKVGTGLKEGSQKVRHSIQVVKRRSVDKSKAPPVQGPPEHVDFTYYTPAEDRPQRRSRVTPRRASSPPAADIAASMPPPEQVHAEKIYFTECPHTYPPAHLPLNLQPVYTTLVKDLLKYPKQEFEQQLRAENRHVDLQPRQISVIQCACANCDYKIRRAEEEKILNNHGKEFPPGYYSNMRYIAYQAKQAKADGLHALAEDYTQDATRLQFTLNNAETQRNANVTKVWKGFRSRWGIKCAGINGFEAQHALEEKYRDRQDRYKRSDLQCTGGHDCAGDCEVCSEISSQTNSSGSSTGYGFMRQGKHGQPIDNVTKEGTMRLEWIVPPTQK